MKALKYVWGKILKRLIEESNSYIYKKVQGNILVETKIYVMFMKKGSKLSFESDCLQTLEIDKYI